MYMTSRLLIMFFKPSIFFLPRNSFYIIFFSLGFWQQVGSDNFVPNTAHDAGMGVLAGRARGGKPRLP